MDLVSHGFTMDTQIRKVGRPPLDTKGTTMKHVWMLVAGALLPVLSGTAGFRIENVRAEPVLPWGKVAVSYDVTGTIPDDADKYTAWISVSNRTLGSVQTVKSLSGDTALGPGHHRIVGDCEADGVVFVPGVFSFGVGYVPPVEYCVVDLSGGPDAESYPVSHLLRAVILNRWTDEYKTTKLVLRRIEPGSFIMGSNQSDESRRVTLTKPFYMGVFEVTQKQWELVMGSWPGSSPSSSYGLGDAYPAYNVSYNNIRGSSSGARWPASSAVDASSFLGRLRAKTGLDFDLPTEAQWEYACRAGTATTYYWGDSMDGSYAWYCDNSGSKTHPVGTRTPNAWGLYDMSGNVLEWCRDWYGTLAYGADPVGSASGSSRVRRGGSWCSNSDYCTSSYRNCGAPSYRDYHIGFRLSRTLP